jgi:hypothetical protein
MGTGYRKNQQSEDDRTTKRLQEGRLAPAMALEALRIYAGPISKKHFNMLIAHSEEFIAYLKTTRDQRWPEAKANEGETS